MEPMKKPEWFELAESDGPKPRPHFKSGFRTLTLSIPLLAITVGVVAAQTSNESPAIAETQSVAIASAAPSIRPGISASTNSCPSTRTTPRPGSRDSTTTRRNGCTALAIATSSSGGTARRSKISPGSTTCPCGNPATTRSSRAIAGAHDHRACILHQRAFAFGHHDKLILMQVPMAQRGHRAGVQRHAFQGVDLSLHPDVAGGAAANAAGQHLRGQRIAGTRAQALGQRDRAVVQPLGRPQQPLTEGLSGHAPEMMRARLQGLGGQHGGRGARHLRQGGHDRRHPHHLGQGPHRGQAGRPRGGVLRLRPRNPPGRSGLAGDEVQGQLAMSAARLMV